MRANEKPNADLNVDLIIVGGGLTGCLTAMRLAAAKPELNFALLESSDKLGGHGTWTFQATDVTPEALEWLKPVISRTWPEYKVGFPGFERTFTKDLHAIRSEDLNRYFTDFSKSKVRMKSKAVKVADTFVVLDDGTVIEANCVLDARGFDHLPPPGANGYCKLMGLDLRLVEPHGITTPILVDAECPQLDGCRFFQLIPWNERRILVREEYYSDNVDMNHSRLTRSIQNFVERKGWKVDSIEREETNIMPVPFTSAAVVPNSSGEGILIGLRGGYYHSTLSSPIADAVRVADYLAGLTELTTAKAREGLVRFRRPFLSRQRFYRFFNRIFFFASEPLLRAHVLQRIYELPTELLERFIAGRTTWIDRLRITLAKPPVRMSRAMRSWKEKSILQRIGEKT